MKIPLNCTHARRPLSTKAAITNRVIANFGDIFGQIRRPLPPNPPPGPKCASQIIYAHLVHDPPSNLNPHQIKSISVQWRRMSLS